MTNIGILSRIELNPPKNSSECRTDSNVNKNGTINNKKTKKFFLLKFRSIFLSVHPKRKVKTAIPKNMLDRAME